MPTTAYVFNEGAITNEYLQGLVSNRAWNNGSPITFYLQFSDFNTNSINDWDEDGAAAAIRLAFDLWENVANITITEVFVQADANLVERIGDADDALGYHFFPDPNDHVSEGEYNQNGTGWDASGLLQGGYGFITLIHELGHALGLEHPHDTDLFAGIPDSGTFTDSSATGAFNLNQGVYTTMSYNDGWATGLYAPTNNYGWQGTPMALDIAAIQAMYGANMSYHTGNNTYTLPGSNGAGTFYQSIWDAGGTDLISYTGSSNAYVFLGEATIDGSATGGGLISFVQGINGGFTIAQNAVIENGTTGSGNDLLDGNDSNNVLNAGGGNDAVVGRLGADTINGGAGNDLLIGDFDGLSTLFAMSAGISSGISLGSGSVTAGVGTNNSTLGSAIDLSSSFSLSANANIANATTIPHVTVSGTGNDQLDIYRVTLNNPFATIIADMDNTSAGLDSFLAIADSSGNILRSSDDSVITFGASGSVVDYGTDGSTDSYLEYTPGAAGVYYIVVGSYPSLSNVPVNETYELQVSIENELNALAYGNFLDYFDIGATGGGNDTINGGDGDDIIYGGDGIDNLTAGAGNDHVYGGAGDDFIFGTSGNNFLYGGDGIDRLYGGIGDEYFEGGIGNDIIQAGGGVDTIYGGLGNDTISGQDGNDEIFGDEGNDTLNGNAGDDTMYGGSADDLMFGGIGIDTMYGGTGIDRLYAGDGNDILEGGDGLDYLFGEAGDDMLSGEAGDDRLAGGLGNDIIIGGLGNDFLNGGDGDDTLEGDEGDDIITAGAGIDLLDGGAGSDFLFGGAGDDTATGGDGADFLYGESGADNLSGNADIDRIYAGSGNDIGYGGDGNDIMLGMDDNDTLYGGNDDDLLLGGNGNDILRGESGNDTLSGDGGDDTLYGGIGNDTVFGNVGIDVLYGEDGNDSLYGGSGNDTLNGGSGNDLLRGEIGNDTLFASSGDDTLYGDDGDDLMYGEDGADVISGGLGIDSLRGGNGNDVLQGGGGNDDLRGQGDNDFMRGDGGDDFVVGGSGDDTYVFFVGDGDDTYSDLGSGIDKAQFFGYSSTDATYSRVLPGSDDLLISFASGDSVTVIGGLSGSSVSVIESFYFAGDTTTVTITDILAGL